LEWITLATGSGAVSNTALAQFDPTNAFNGIYSIRLRSIDASGQRDEETISVIITCARVRLTATTQRGI
jgi:hypothetical protein